MTALTTYLTQANSTTLPNADSMVAVAGASGTLSGTNTINSSTGWTEIGFGAATSSGGANIGAPSGKGALWDVTTLVGNQLNAGNYSGSIQLALSQAGKSTTGDMYLRFYRYNSSSTVYTFIGQIVNSSQVINSTSAQTITFASTQFTNIVFSTNEKLYIDCWYNISSNTMTSGGGIAIFFANSSTQGIAAISFPTPGFGAPTIAITDSLTLSDVSTITDVFVPVDILTTLDVFASTDVFVPVDVLTTTDILTITDVFVTVDILTTLDVFASTNVFVPVDNLTNVENTSYALSFNIIENSSSSDQFGSTSAISTSDTLNLVEQLLESLTIVFTEIISVNDAGVFNPIFVFLDQINNLEVISYTLTFNAFFDVIIPTDSQVTTVIPVLVDALQEAERIFNVISGNYSDVLTITDTLVLINPSSVVDYALETFHVRSGITTIKMR